MGFTPPQSSSVLTPVFRSLGASFSELIGHSTSPDLLAPVPTTIALVTGTTETLPSSVASSEPPATVIHTESQAAPVPDPTQTASASLPMTEGHIAQSSGSDDDDGTRF